MLLELAFAARRWYNEERRKKPCSKDGTFWGAIGPWEEFPPLFSLLPPSLPPVACCPPSLPRIWPVLCVDQHCIHPPLDQSIVAGRHRSVTRPILSAACQTTGD